MKRILTTYPIISTLALICLLLGLLTSFNGDAMYDLLAFHSKPVYGWQYVSGTLMHGSKGAPIWFLWVHLLLNGLMILPFGGLLERKRGAHHGLRHRNRPFAFPRHRRRQRRSFGYFACQRPAQIYVQPRAVPPEIGLAPCRFRPRRQITGLPFKRIPRTTQPHGDCH